MTTNYFSDAYTIIFQGNLHCAHSMFFHTRPNDDDEIFWNPCSDTDNLALLMDLAFKLSQIPHLKWRYHGKSSIILSIANLQFKNRKKSQRNSKSHLEVGNLERHRNFFFTEIFHWNILDSLWTAHTEHRKIFERFRPSVILILG